MAERPSNLNPDDYREGCLLRLQEAWSLYDDHQWVGAIYLSGRGVEALLRGAILKRLRRLEVGHDLKQLLAELRSSLDMPDEALDRIENSVNEVAVLWRNDVPFTGNSRFKRLLKLTGRLQRTGVQKIKGDPLKANAKSFMEACQDIINAGEPVWFR